MRTFRVLGALLVLVLVASLARSADAKVKEPPPELHGPGGARLPSRPEIIEATSIDYAALPLAAEAPVKRWTEAAIRVDEWPPSPPVQGEKAGPSWTVSVVPYTCFARVGDYLLPSGRQFSAYDGKLENASGSEVEWFVVDDGTTTDHTMEIRRFMGTFEKHLAMASTEETVGATALVPAEV